MPRIWPLRGIPNFIITVVGVSGIGFFVVGTYQEQRFKSPVVTETVKILNKNEKMKEIIGYPIGYKSSTSNEITQKKQETYYNFKVVGPRGSTEVQVIANSLPAKDVYIYGKQLMPENLKTLQAKLQDLKEKCKQLQPEAKKTSWIKKNQSKKEYQHDLQEMKSIQSQIIYEKEKLLQKRQEYYIPEKQFYSQIITAKPEQQQKTIPADSQLFRIDSLACNLSNKSRISIINQGKLVGVTEQQQRNINKIEELKIGAPTYKQLSKQVFVNVSDLSEEQLASYSKHKTTFMYQKYGMYRMIGGMAIMIMAGALFVYFNANKTVNLTNSVFFNITQSRFERNPVVKEFLKKKGLSNISLDKNVAGGMKKNSFHCYIGVKGLTMGKLQVVGKYIPKETNYKFQKFVLHYSQNNQNQHLDLLK